jgi:hypothetical protein
VLWARLVSKERVSPCTLGTLSINRECFLVLWVRLVSKRVCFLVLWARLVLKIIY